MKNSIEQNTKILTSLEAAIIRLSLETCNYHLEKVDPAKVVLWDFWEDAGLQDTDTIPRVDGVLLASISRVKKKRTVDEQELIFKFDKELYIVQVPPHELMKAAILLNNKYFNSHKPSTK